MKPSAPNRLVVRVWFIEGRYHGEPEWPPAPARLFQALVAASTTSSVIDAPLAGALQWLESLPAPVIIAPAASIGQTVKLWVPNNDLDAKGGDPNSVALIRTGKRVRPRIFDARVPVVYDWPVPADVEPALVSNIRSLATGLYQLGRGVDMAWATADLLDARSHAALLAQHPGRLHLPSAGPAGDGTVLPCPHPGSLESLVRRYEGTLKRLAFVGEGKARFQLFQQPPKPRFKPVRYDCTAHRAVFDLRSAAEPAVYAPTAFTSIVGLTERLRDAAAARLAEALPEAQGEIERALVGRQLGDGPRLAPELRVRLMALPSFGHPHVDRGIRRLLVEVPAGSPLLAEDVFWACSGLVLTSPGGAELVVSPAEDQSMLDHFGLPAARAGRVWRTVTPAALPSDEAAPRASSPGGPPDGTARALYEHRAARSVLQALRHAGVRTPVQQVRVQREPFEPKGERAEAFAPQTRFPPHRLWHVELVFRDPVRGPLVIGDGRFLGLGLMAPEPEPTGVFAFNIIEGLEPGASPLEVATALRRAIMARVQQSVGPHKPLPPFVSGHTPDGRPVDGSYPHLSFVADLAESRLLVVAPHLRQQRPPRESEIKNLRTLERALTGFDELRAGAAGRLVLEHSMIRPAADSLFAPSREWISRTPYVVNRHVKHVGADRAIANDIQAACAELKLARPRVEVLEARGMPGLGLSGLLRLRFDRAVRGPLLLGRTRHKGGGLFGHFPESSDVH